MTVLCDIRGAFQTGMAALSRGQPARDSHAIDMRMAVARLWTWFSTLTRAYPAGGLTQGGIKLGRPASRSNCSTRFSLSPLSLIIRITRLALKSKHRFLNCDVSNLLRLGCLASTHIPFRLIRGWSCPLRLINRHVLVFSDRRRRKLHNEELHNLGWSTQGVDHSGRAVCRMNRLCRLERWGRGLKSHSRHACLCAFVFCVCVMLCVGSGLATVWSPVQGVLQTVYRITKLKKEARGQ
jgi:hypothetical protein